MRFYALLIYFFLYAPIALIVGFSFNAGRYAMDWQGFSTEWYGKAFSNPFAVKALWTSVTVGLWTAVLATLIAPSVLGWYFTPPQGGVVMMKGDDAVRWETDFGTAELTLRQRGHVGGEAPRALKRTHPPRPVGENSQPLLS